MLERYATGAVAVALATVLAIGAAHAQATNAKKYPNWKGHWVPIGQASTFDPSKPAGRGQQAPLTPEYQKVLDQSISDQAIGGVGNDAVAQCYAAGMPRMMSYHAQEYVVMPETTYIMLGGDDNLRRVWTDGRTWPATIQPTYQGYSIGRWIDEDNDGTYDVLEVETRGPFKGPRSFDPTGLPLHQDNESTFTERFFLDKTNPNILHDVITVTDHALTRPWTADKTFQRHTDPLEEWPEEYCHVTNRNLLLGKENYRLDDNGVLMPTRPGQEPPDLRYFRPPPRR